MEDWEKDVIRHHKARARGWLAATSPECGGIVRACLESQQSRPDRQYLWHPLTAPKPSFPPQEPWLVVILVCPETTIEPALQLALAMDPDELARVYIYDLSGLPNEDAMVPWHAAGLPAVARFQEDAAKVKLITRQFTTEINLRLLSDYNEHPEWFDDEFDGLDL